MSAAAWALVRRQHGLIARRQLLGLGLSSRAIEHRIARGRLHPVHRGVYAVGRRELTREGVLMAAVLACGDGAVLSHRSAAELWEIRTGRGRAIEVSVPDGRNPRVPGIKVHRRAGLKPTRRHGIAVTNPTDTLVSIAPGLSGEQLERAVNEAVNRGHTDPERLRRELDDRRGAGVTALKKRLDRDTFTLTDSELEQRFLPIARKAGLPKPETQALVNGYRVDFYWPDLRIVVEADSLRFHRTPSRQRRDSERDHAHSIAGLIPLRFSHGQITFEAGYVEGVLRDVLARRQPRPAQRYAEPLSAGAASAP